jgi:hypothetical protein
MRRRDDKFSSFLAGVRCSGDIATQRFTQEFGARAVLFLSDFFELCRHFWRKGDREGNGYSGHAQALSQAREPREEVRTCHSGTTESQPVRCFECKLLAQILPSRFSPKFSGVWNRSPKRKCCRHKSLCAMHGAKLWRQATKLWCKSVSP